MPKNTPAAIIDKLNRELNAAAVDTAMQVRFADLGGPPVTGSPADFGRIIADDVAGAPHHRRHSGARHPSRL